MLCFAMPEDSIDENARAAAIGAAELAELQKRSDARGLARLAGHLLAIGLAGTLYALSLGRPKLAVLEPLAALALGFTLVTMFTATHDGVHRTAFRSQRLNDAVAWFADLWSFYNSTFYRPYHDWAHRYT